MNVQSIIYTSSEDDFDPNFVHVDGSTNFCSCSTPSTTIRSINGNTSAKISEESNYPFDIKGLIAPNDEDALHIEDIELRFKISH